MAGPGVLDVTRLAAEGLDDRAPGQPDQPDDDEGPVRELIPIGEQQVVVRLPVGARVRRVQLLREGRVLPVPLDGAQVRVSVPSIRDHEIVAIDLE